MCSKVSSEENAQLLCQSCPKWKHVAHSKPGNFSRVYLWRHSLLRWSLGKPSETVQQPTGSTSASFPGTQNTVSCCHLEGCRYHSQGDPDIPGNPAGRESNKNPDLLCSLSSLHPWPDTLGSHCCVSPHYGPHSQPPRTGSRSGGRTGCYLPQL